jgi:hypothetical protein
VFRFQVTYGVSFFPKKNWSVSEEVEPLEHRPALDLVLVSPQFWDGHHGHPRKEAAQR